MKQIIALSELVLKLQDYPNLNRGGCGVVAAHIAKRLQHIFPTRVVVYNENPDIKVDNIRNKIKNTNSPTQWEKKGFRWDHVYVEFDFENKTYLMDSDGIQVAKDTIDLTTRNYEFILHKSGYLTIDEICAHAAVSTNWNWAFDRWRIPAIKKRIHRFFIHYTQLIQNEIEV